MSRGPGMALAVAGLLAMLAGGCFSSSEVRSAPQTDPLDKALVEAEKNRALQIACQKANEEGIPVESEYTATVAKMPDCWWVRFDRIGSTSSAGHPTHFLIEVYRGGKTILLKGKNSSPSAGSARNVSSPRQE